ncbi:alpha-amylase [Erwinia sp. CPCC 100877]|nr:alpha-amylase [Erwinia sp. CPCC 100877]
MENRTILQSFEWYLPADGQHWQRLAQLAEQLKNKGINSIWLPPAYKGAGGKEDVGYAPYDLYDLGEFDQKGTIATKYGTKEEYLACIQALKAAGLEVYGDIVFDHLMGADEEETVSAVKYHPENRNKVITGKEEISAWTKFTFPGRKQKYNDYIWTWRNFSGIDYDDRRKDHGIFNFAGKGWGSDVDKENGNYDYLMGCNLDMSYPETVEQLDKWGKWYQSLTDMDGYRLDAVKHIQFNYFPKWLLNRREEKGKELFVVGEYWHGGVDKLINYIDSSGAVISLFDVPLHYHLCEAASSDGHYDMRKIFEGTLVKERPEWAVTFVDNHDTQKGQSLESWVEGWFKVHAYTLVLLRKAGTPVVFWGDLFGMPSQNVDAVGNDLELLLKIREQLSCGAELDYFDDSDVIGWIRTGTFEQKQSGCAVIMSNASEGTKKMTVSAFHAGQTFVDVLGNNDAKVTLDETGTGSFPVNEKEVSVYVNASYADQLKKEINDNS